MQSAFAQDVLNGLSANPKRLSSKYFYNEQGSRLFQAIMQLEEYYLTRREFDILEANKTQMLPLFQARQIQTEAVCDERGLTEEDDEPFELIEFGAGDGLKIKILLEYFLQQQARFTYIPIDISADALNGLLEDLHNAFPNLATEPMQAEYFQALHLLKTRSSARKVVLFLGANIGNFNEVEAVQFLSELRESLNPGDLLMIGFDLKKDPTKILAAYNDASGVTRDFNLNLLQRINDELGGNFDLRFFQHYPTYDPTSGEARSYLVSKKEQTVTIAKLNASFHFNAWEPIHTEISRKYDLSTIISLAERSGYQPIRHFFDPNHDFTDTVWMVNES